MDLKNMFDSDGDERAVSPVIGVILMVAITVILAAVIGAFVIGIGEDQEVQPTASFNFDFSSADDPDNAEVVVRHSTGDTIDTPDSLFINIDGDRAEWNSDVGDTFGDDTDGENEYEIINNAEYAISSGSQITVEKIDGEAAPYDWEGESVSVVWESETGDSSATLSSTTAPN